MDALVGFIDIQIVGEKDFGAWVELLMVFFFLVRTHLEDRRFCSGRVGSLLAGSIQGNTDGITLAILDDIGGFTLRNVSIKQLCCFHSLLLYSNGLLYLLQTLCFHSFLLRFSSGKKFWITLNIGNIPTSFRFFHFAFPNFSQIPYKSRETGPFGSVHVDVTLVLDNFLVHIVCIHARRSVTTPQDVHVSLLKLSTESIHYPSRILREQFHLPQVRVAGYVTLESVRVAALLIAHLAVESQLLETFCLHAIRNVFRCSTFGARHD